MPRPDATKHRYIAALGDKAGSGLRQLETGIEDSGGHLTRAQFALCIRAINRFAPTDVQAAISEALVSCGAVQELDAKSTSTGKTKRGEVALKDSAIRAGRALLAHHGAALTAFLQEGPRTVEDVQNRFGFPTGTPGSQMCQALIFDGLVTTRPKPRFRKQPIVEYVWVGGEQKLDAPTSWFVVDHKLAKIGEAYAPNAQLLLVKMEEGRSFHEAAVETGSSRSKEGMERIVHYLVREGLLVVEGTAEEPIYKLAKDPGGTPGNIPPGGSGSRKSTGPQTAAEWKSWVWEKASPKRGDVPFAWLTSEAHREDWTAPEWARFFRDGEKLYGPSGEDGRRLTVDVDHQLVH